MVMSKECIDDLTVLLDTVRRRVLEFLKVPTPEAEYVLDVLTEEVGAVSRDRADHLLFDDDSFTG